jgi:hypothetical protein
MEENTEGARRDVSEQVASRARRRHSKILGLRGRQYLPHVAAPSLLGQTELNPDNSGRINRQPVAFRGPKVNLFCSLDSCFIETVA